MKVMILKYKLGNEYRLALRSTFGDITLMPYKCIPIISLYCDVFCVYSHIFYSPYSFS